MAVAGLVLAMWLCPALSFPQRPAASDKLWLQEIVDHDGLYIAIYIATIACIMTQWKTLLYSLSFVSYNNIIIIVILIAFMFNFHACDHVHCR